MKKVLALVLAVMMLSTMAFAAGIGTGAGSTDEATGEKIEEGTGGTNEVNLLPGKKIKLYQSDRTIVFDSNFSDKVTGEADYENATLGLVKDINSDNYSISGLKYNEGKSLVEDVYIDDDDDQLVIQLADDYDMTKAKSLDLELTLRGKGKFSLTSADVAEGAGYEGKDAGDKVSVPDVDIRIKATISYGKAYLVIEDTDDDFDVPDDLRDGDSAEDELIDSADLGDYVIEVSADGGSYGTMTQELNDGEVTMEVRVYDGNEFFLGYNTDANSDILRANADSDADLYFYEWEGSPTFDATATVYFNDADESYYVYEIKNGRLTEVGSYDDDEGCWVVKARTLGAYVVSSEELENAADEDGDTSTDAEVENPDTGANDVVGIAAALGVVALVSAAAVSLKK